MVLRAQVYDLEEDQVADVKVRLSHFWRDYQPNQEIVVDAETATSMIREGIAVAATVRDARKVDVPEDTAATKKK